MLPSARSLAALFLFLLLLPLAFASAQRLPGDVVPRHYEIRLEPDLATGALSGRETIAVEVVRPTAAVVLHSLGLELSEVAVVAGGDRRPATVALDPARETATLALAAPLPVGEARIEIAFSGRLGEGLRGLYAGSYQAAGGSRRYAATQLQATYARMAFPCFDEPSLKATFDLTVVVAAGEVAISNGRVIADEPGPGPEQHTVRFATSPKMSTYLLALAVGDFRCVEGGAAGVPIRVCALAEKAELGRFALAATERFLAFYDRWYGIRYPFGKLDMVAVPDYEWSGMENTAAVFYRERGLLVDPATAAVANKRAVASVVAHEIAHQWFGDLVTMRWWDGVWLNEGFATWMTAKALQDWDPAWDQSVQEAENAAGVETIDSLHATRRIRQNGETPGEIKELFDAVAYQKGAAVLRMVEAWLGPEVFRKGVNAYLARHAWGNATAEDFWSELARVSGRPVDRVLASFVDQPGLPMVAGEARCVDGTTRVALAQRRFFQDSGRLAAASPEVWTVPVCLRTPAGEPRCELLAAREQTVELPGCAPWILLDAGAYGFYRAAYSGEALRALAAAAGTALSPAEQVALVDDQWALVRAGRVGIGDFLALAEGLRGSRERAVLAILLDRLRFAGDHLAGPEGRARFDGWLRELLAPAARELGEEPAPAETDDRKALRALLFTALGEAGDPETLARARRIVESALAAPAGAGSRSSPDVDPSLAFAAFLLAARSGDAALWERLAARLDTARTPEETFRYLLALAAFRDPALARRTLDLVLSPRVRAQDLPSLSAALLMNPAAREPTWAVLQARWPELREKVVSFGGRGAVSALGAFCDVARADEIERFFAAHPAPGAERTLQRSLESIRDCVQLEALQGEPFRAWLAARPAASRPASLP